MIRMSECYVLNTRRLFRDYMERNGEPPSPDEIESLLLHKKVLWHISCLKINVLGLYDGLSNISFHENSEFAQYKSRPAARGFQQSRIIQL